MSLSAAAGVGRLCRSASSVVAKAASGFHLLHIDGYSQTKNIPPGQKLSSQGFSIGGHTWRLDCYPTGLATTNPGSAVSVYLQLTTRNEKELLQARYSFSILDQAGAAAYELPAATGTFVSVPLHHHHHHYHHHARLENADKHAVEDEGPGCGHEEFITREELERREGLVRNDALVLRCDVQGVTEIAAGWLAHDDLHGFGYGSDCTDDEEDEQYPAYGAPRHRRRRRHRRPDDGEYVKWCMAQRPAEPPHRRH